MNRDLEFYFFFVHVGDWVGRVIMGRVDPTRCTDLNPCNRCTQDQLFVEDIKERETKYSLNLNFSMARS